MKFTVSHTWAQEEYREFEIEAESLEEAKKFAQGYYDDGCLWDEKGECGEVLVDKMEVKEK